MYQIDNSTAATTIPPSAPAGTPGFFTDGNPATGVAATILPAEFMNTIMMETLNVLSAAGITPVKGQYNQLALAISKIVSSGVSWDKIANKPTTVDGFGITDAMKTGAGGLLSKPAVVNGNINAISDTRFFSMADATGDRPAAVAYGAGVHISFPSGGATDIGIDFAGSVSGNSWFGGRRYSADGTGVWVQFWTSNDFDPANKAEKATTLSGYGIVNAYTKSETDAALANKANKATTLNGYGITDAYTKAQSDASISGAISNKADKATTLGGYGIADAYTKTQADTAIGNAVSNKADKATTLSGYGITNAYTTTQVDGLLSGKADKSGAAFTGAISISVAQDTGSPGLRLTNSAYPGAQVALKLETTSTALYLLHNGGSSGGLLRNASGGVADLDLGTVTSNGSACHTAATFMKPVAGQWVSLANGATLPAGGTWAYSLTNYNSSGALISSSTGLTPGGTQLGGTYSTGFAWRFQ
ncbi:hypothetical protein GNF76_23000 [Pseudomonas sp. CCM 7893]|uniref:Phage tail protein n=1 Tax=Pseudomonas spelaei TaxID=1055469 RepID=A0A6I3WHB0_9PSED|nr:hypothetical protein [Pseudomonas spelaei]MUF07224.1 hypothetical protein [Pseudomonas spelaei]